MTFKEQIESDVLQVFLNDGEFAERMDVRYNGAVYADIPVVLSENLQTPSPTLTMGRAARERGNLGGVHVASTVAHMAARDLPIVPEAGQWIEFRDGEAAYTEYWRRYRIVKSDAEMGMLILELEAFDE